ncbi:class 1b ribonucleoside-diphosphate reductase subunit beta [Heyndrickxia oleronia]|uniref:class 1b ribonucleoside-diphosphate reductase subunit beta n=1 Tax=Heyndrickxia oleronia TaxID=38875 RepID=UPI003F209D92
MLNLNSYEAVNWNRPSSELANVFWKQQTKQYWLESEVAVSKDILKWKSFEHQDTYRKVLGGLTLLDTIQTNIGMNQISEHITDLQEKAVLTLFGAMEAIHARSYSYIFTTLCSNQEIDEVFEWIKSNPYLQYKASKISEQYQGIVDKVTLWKAMFSSVLLESFLFYSGFFYPLYLAGQGMLKNSAEIISLILRDEALHGVAVGYFAQNVFKEFDENTQTELKLWGYQFLLDLYDNEMKYTEELYSDIGLSAEVKKYVRYNANKALMNVGFDKMFDDENIDPIVMNGIRTDSVTHDFFSQKGNSYTIAKVKAITDETFRF